MALFSDIDWVILLAVAAFLLFGDRGHAFVRQVGRWYGRFLNLKAELMTTVSAAAGLPTAPNGAPVSLRQAILGDALVDGGASVQVAAPGTGPAVGASPIVGVPTQVAPLALRAVETLSYGAAFGPGTWSVATTSNPGEVVWLR
jgi:hypothetical protein